MPHSAPAGAAGTMQDHLWRPMTRPEIDRFVRSLMSAYEVAGVQERRGRLTLERLADPAALVLDFPPQVHSPKKFLFPNWERLFSFRLGGKVRLEAERTATPRILFGMHPCDLHAVQVLDNCLFEGEADSVYRAKREAAILVGVDCTPDEHCFCTSTGTDRVAAGFDLFLHRVGEEFLVQVGSERGETLLRRHARAVAGRPAEPPLPLQAKPCPTRIETSPGELAGLLEESYDHDHWRQIGERCLGCGACTLLCPTCYCFNVQDQVHLNMEGGERVRIWDSCQFDQFTRVAGGRDFRSDQSDRQRHRFFRKYKYLWDRHRRLACVGCGRCSRECLAGIRPVEVLNQLLEKEERHLSPAAPASEYQPLPAEIVEVEPLTCNEKLFRLRLPEPIDFAPGAFVEISVFGLGEAPFTIASASGDGRQVEIVARAKGPLTQALHRLRPGDMVGIRGPFGNGFPVAELAGRDLLLVAGGMGLITLRSLLLTVLDRRADFGRILLLYGAHDPDALLFRQDLETWHRSGEIDCRFVLREPGPAWGVPAGDVSLLFRHLDLDPRRSSAAVSGPAEMYRFINPLLFRLGFAEETVFLNLERHMKCGLGKCGKCRINEICVCESGPIFPYSRVKHLKEAIER